MVITYSRCVLQVVNNRDDRAVLPVWCMFNMSSPEKCILYTKLDPQCYPWGLCVLFPHHTLAEKEGCLEDFLPVQKQRDGKQRAQNLFSPFSLGNYTDKAWKIEFFSLKCRHKSC